MVDSEGLSIPQSIWDELPVMVKTTIAKLPEDKQEGFVEEYRRKRKSVGVAYLAYLFGLHYAYLGKWWLTKLYWVTFGGFFVWALVDLFRTYFMVKDANKDIAVSTIRTMKMVEMD